LYQYDGVVRQFLVDDKGSVLIGVFGTPPNAHENDPARAVLAAMLIQKYGRNYFLFFILFFIIYFIIIFLFFIFLECFDFHVHSLTL
jgi:hypothetical protein